MVTPLEVPAEEVRGRELGRSLRRHARTRVFKERCEDLVGLPLLRLEARVIRIAREHEIVETFKDDPMLFTHCSDLLVAFLREGCVVEVHIDRINALICDQAQGDLVRLALKDLQHPTLLAVRLCELF